MEYTLEKLIWTEADFDEMNWQYASIYQMVMSGGDLEFDIDYVFQNNVSEVKGFMSTYWLAPCTLVFKQIREVTFDFDLVKNWEYGFRIDFIERDGDRWTIVTRNGDISFVSEGYEQFVRQQPTFEYTLSLGAARNGLSLERTTNQSNPYLQNEDYLTERKKLSELYEYAKKRKQKQLDMEELEERRLNGEINTPEFLKQKKELWMAIDGYGYWLKGSIFEKP